MSKFRQPYTRKHSPLFDGDSIFKQLNSSSFGGFQAAMQDVRLFLPCSLRFKLQLPKVIVIGGKSAGKSSLLENITKCAVFPRDRDLCTKRPVKLQLRQVASADEASVQVLYQDHRVTLPSTDGILGEVDRIMKPLTTVTDDEIVIKISQVDVPTIELVDLPGIQLYPQDLCEQTTELVKSYLQGQDTLVLCVVDATIPSLDSSVAVKMVRDADKLPSTILALTKADLIRDEESIVEHIFERVLSRSTESKDLPGLAGCVAVVNRLHQDKVSLLEAEAAEEAIFNKLLEDPAEAYAPTTVQQQLRQNTTTAQLIAKLDRLFSEHIKQKWMPSVLGSLQDNMSGIADQIGQLGLSPDELDPAQVIKKVVYEVQLACGWKWVSQRGIQLSNIPNDLGNMECSLPFLDRVWAEQQLEWGSGPWALAHNSMRSIVLYAVHESLASDSYLRLVKLMFAKALHAKHPLKLQRFSSLHQLLHTELLPAVVSQALAACKPALTDMVISLFNQHCYGTMPPDAFTELDGRVRGYITQQLQAHIAHLANPGMIPSSFTLTEDDSTAAARAALLDKLKKLQAAIHTINRIAGNPEASRDYAFVTSTEVSKQPAESDSIMPEIGSAPFSACGHFSWRWPVSRAKRDTDSWDQATEAANLKELFEAAEDPLKELFEAAEDPLWTDHEASKAQQHATTKDKENIHNAQQAGCNRPIGSSLYKTLVSEVAILHRRGFP